MYGPPKWGGTHTGSIVHSAAAHELLEQIVDDRNQTLPVEVRRYKLTGTKIKWCSGLTEAFPLYMVSTLPQCPKYLILRVYNRFSLCLLIRCSAILVE